MGLRYRTNIWRAGPETSDDAIMEGMLQVSSATRGVAASATAIAGSDVLFGARLSFNIDDLDTSALISTSLI